MAKKKTKSSTNHIEDRTFQNLIRRYTKHRDWGMVEVLFQAYGKVLEDRE